MFCKWPSHLTSAIPEDILMADSLYGARLQGIMVIVFIKPCARLSNDEYNYGDSLQACAIEEIGH